MVISCAQPCIQGLSDSDAAADMAVTVNNRLASTIANNTERFGGFAALSMHNATEAALELQRAVKELGFLGMFSVHLCGRVSSQLSSFRRIIKRLSTVWI
jgi:2,3-dihydroxybenzoate decarboxylase